VAAFGLHDACLACGYAYVRFKWRAKVIVSGGTRPFAETMSRMKASNKLKMCDGQWFLTLFGDFTVLFFVSKIEHQFLKVGYKDALNRQHVR
jgi:hypothetical protein